MKILLFSVAFLLVTLITKAEYKVIDPPEIKVTDSTILSLMPVPAKVTRLEGKFRINRNLKFYLDAPINARTKEGFQRMIKRLDERVCLFFTPVIQTGSLNNLPGPVIVTCKRKGELKPAEDESYNLLINDSVILIAAETDLGTLHGMETLLQLLSADGQGFYFPCIKIEDTPRFVWRGLMIDVARHFLPSSVLERNIDAMASVKMNVLHLHLSDDQGFRIECKSFPLLHQMGSDGMYYTQLQMKEIIAYADARGIRVIPEFDMPGHTQAWFPGYPQLATVPGKHEIEREFGIFDGAMNPAKEGTYRFLDKFITEMSGIFPDEYFHIGGDECNGIQWNESPEVQSFMKKNKLKNNHELQAYFNVRINHSLQKNHKIMTGWEQIMNEKLPKDIIIQSWKGDKSLIEAVKQGYQVILSKGYYIDLLFPASDHYQVDPVPANSDLTDEQKKLILGGEATMWSEYVTTENVDSRIWPRTAAIAERFWSPESVKDIDDMYERLETTSLDLEWLGITHVKNYDMMLRRLTLGADITPLKTLTDIIEPLNEYQRWGDFKDNNGFTLKSYSPYTRVMDAANPDPGVARKFTKSITQYVLNPTEISKQEIYSQLLTWKKNQDKLQLLIDFSPVPQEIESLSNDLSSLSTIGIESLDYISTHSAPSAKWLEESRDKISKSRKPRGQTKLMIVDGVELLFKKAEAN
jgi:hexosaminidase